MSAAASYSPLSPESHRKNIVKLLERASRRHHLWDVFGDFVEMAAIAVSNGVDLAQREPREARYMALIRRYEPEEQKLFPQMLAELTMALEFGPDDVLGKVFGELELGNAARGQFFTPYSVCALMARQQVGDGDDLRRHIASKGFITLLEPAVGAGAMVIAMAEALQQEGLSYQNHMHVTAQDIDSRAVHMSYLQLSLLHIPATIILGNTLAAEEREHWYTPAHVFGLWSVRLRRGYALGSDLDQDQREPADTRQNIIVPVRNLDQLSQLVLF
ncbi:N-6 DNA methylase [Pseudomonas nitroreducens]|uniref:N-6 DNA methylase n=1 Tax=Pseudomonas nitroreducens TaxID=46680 RepID=UPI0024475227|nr:N-6 DNA methylase [Pseudomonas nitroreducens]MDG9857398.1 N-6 DNA methylase [Pseudomonas nitroreducens]MDH1076509.1 N-6 DNA methylase [Pseudomonas nitroreducens]